ncbi:ABC transporter substrate-binding protein [Shewanella amazonensis]|uniref:Solute-binding protein family 3/N-terminal domain-containing protein n=1 Tax=Shewanella amazonensis (strain ATCC BAA-1098 / SB2B) TaxID=326297 RepID=A1S4B2_SHEAM|nr:transporter substrate-binding domain-containing protein [Shewanella amazonensis]ABL99218.1 conserved hypothetical protein [Shewanella amazonensis SB2B]
MSPKRLTLLICLLLPLWGIAQEPKTLTLVATDLPPFYAESLDHFGPVAVLVLEALQRRGYQVELKFYPFIRATALIKAGKADAIIGLWYRAERESWAYYSRPLQGTEIVFMARKQDHIGYHQLSELQDKRIGISRGYANPAAIASNKLHTEEADSDETNLRKLLLGRVDLIVISRNVAQHLIAHSPAEYQGQFEFVGEPLAKEVFHLGVSKTREGNVQLLEDFNQAIVSMEEDGSMAAILSPLNTTLN